MSKVRFGVSIAPDPEDNSQGKEYFENILKFLDSLNEVYESIWIPDHLVPIIHSFYPNTHERALSNDYLECLTTTSYLLPLYPNLIFGQLVLCNNFRNPALLAKMTSTLQVISGGRFILGIGAGWIHEEHRQYGYDYPSPRTRIRQLEEAIQIIRMMWTEDEVTFQGKYHRIEKAYCNPKPDPVPPILIGGGGEKYTLKIVAKYADWWNGGCLGVETWTHKLHVLAKHCDNLGRDYREITKSALWPVAVAASDEDALKLAKLSQYYSEWTFIHGSPESVVSQMGELVDAGVEYFQIGFPQHRNIETAQLFAEEVIPELQT